MLGKGLLCVCRISCLSVIHTGDYQTAALSLFANNMFLRPGEEELDDFVPDWQVIALPGLKLHAKNCGTRQHNGTIISFKHKIILIAGTKYTGEIKKGIFSILNYILPQEKNVLSMHCSANIGRHGDTAIFFGSSGTGKPPSVRIRIGS